MTLPHSYGLALALTILTMLCWGSWANVLKIAKGWRFELLYYDYSIGVALGAALAGLTFGTWGSDGLRFVDDLAQAGARNLLCGFAGGVIYNLSNILVVGAISVAGMGVAFPIGVGLALVVGVIWNYFVNPQGNPWLLFAGVALVVGAIIVDAIAYRAHAVSQSAAGDKTDAAAKRAATWKGIRLSAVGGILMGMFYPLVEIGKSGPRGLGPYAVGFVFALGVLASVFVYNLYFMRFPIAGPRLRFADYLRGSSWFHFLGIVGGIVWIAGSLVELRGRQRAARVAGGACDQLRHRARIDHGWSSLGRAGVAGVRGRRSEGKPAACAHVPPLCDRAWGGLDRATLCGPLIGLI